MTIMPCFPAAVRGVRVWARPGVVQGKHLMVATVTQIRNCYQTLFGVLDLIAIDWLSLIQAFLQRIVNGSRRVEREPGLGRGRTDLLVVWNYPGGMQRAMIELKVLRKALESTLAEGLAQTWECADRCGAEEAHLVIFDRRLGHTWEEKTWQRSEQHAGLTITVWGM